MKNLTVAVNDSEYEKFGFKAEIIPFDELKDKISIEFAKEALIRCNEIAKSTGLAELTLDEINAEINALRNAKNSD